MIILFSDDMMANVREKSWDKLKIVCRQTYSKDTQYGLSFISLRTSNTSPISPNPSKIQRFANQKALNSLFGLTEKWVILIYCNFEKLFLISQNK